MQRRQKRQYTAEFRAEGVKLVLEQGVGLAEVARRLDLPAKSLANWVRAARAGKRIDEHRVQPVSDLAAENSRLRAENARLKLEREILRNHHSDRGSSYCSGDYQKLLKRYEMRCSMSRKGDCYDNAPMESCFKSLKVERVSLRRYATREQARADVFSYMKGFYNTSRLHSSLDYLSPREFERRFAARQAA